MSSNCGLLYVATGDQHSSEAIKNIILSRPYLQNLKTCLVTDKVRGSEYLYFDFVRIHDSPIFGYRDKISSLLNLPFDITLFIDSDAFISSSLDPIFQLASVVDFAAAHAPVRHPPGWSDNSPPLSFPEFNSGVMLFRRSQSIAELIRHWLKIYDDLFVSFNQHWDQASLRSSLWRHLLINKNFRLGVLPPEANLRTTKPWIAGRGMPVSVVHGRFDSLEVDNFLSFLNTDIDRFRTWAEWLTLYPCSSIKPRFDRTYS